MPLFSSDAGLGLELLFSLALTCAKIGAFIYGYSRVHPDISVPSSRVGHLDELPEPRPLWRRRWVIGIVFYLLIGASIIVPLDILADQRSPSGTSPLITVIMVLCWPVIVGMLGHSLL